MQVEPPTFSDLSRPRPWKMSHTNAGYVVVDDRGTLVALNLSLRDAILITAASDEEFESDDD